MFEYQVSVWGNLSQLHEGASIDLWYQHVRLSCSVQYRTISGMIYTYRLSVIACKLIISVELYYTITELVACVCVCISTLSSNSHSLNQPAILCSYTWVSIYTNLHCNMVANNMLLTSAHAAHQCSVWSNVSHEPNILASRLLPVLCAISNIVRMDSSYDNMQG